MSIFGATDTPVSDFWWRLSGFQSQSEFCLIRTLWRRMWYMFSEIHLWCDTSAGVYSQHSSQSLSPHACFSRGRMPDLNHRPYAWQVDALTTATRLQKYTLFFVLNRTTAKMIFDENKNLLLIAKGSTNNSFQFNCVFSVLSSHPPCIIVFGF